MFYDSNLLPIKPCLNVTLQISTPLPTADRTIEVIITHHLRFEQHQQWLCVVNAQRILPARITRFATEQYMYIVLDSALLIAIVAI